MKRTKLSFEEMLREVPQEIRAEVDMEFDVSARINDLMNRRGLSKAEFARAIGRRQSEVSQWLSGQYNFSLRTIALLSAFFGEPLLRVLDK